MISSFFFLLCYFHFLLNSFILFSLLLLFLLLQCYRVCGGMSILVVLRYSFFILSCFYPHFYWHSPVWPSFGCAESESLIFSIQYTFVHTIHSFQTSFRCSVAAIAAASSFFKKKYKKRSPYRCNVSLHKRRVSSFKSIAAVETANTHTHQNAKPKYEMAHKIEEK